MYGDHKSLHRLTYVDNRGDFLVCRFFVFEFFSFIFFRGLPPGPEKNKQQNSKTKKTVNEKIR
jgi:hypothetical protein